MPNQWLGLLIALACVVLHADAHTVTSTDQVFRHPSALPPQLALEGGGVPRTISDAAVADPRILEPGMAMLADAPLLARSKTNPRHVRVFVRLVRIDPLLHASGLDSLTVYSELATQLRESQHLEERPDEATPALDVVLSLDRSVGAEIRQAVVDVEVGRNLMESGQSRRLVWHRTETAREPANLSSRVQELRTILRGIVAEYSHS